MLCPHRGFVFVIVCLLLLGDLQSSALFAQAATGKKGVVATVNPLATQSGIAAMKAGGNAVDAAVAAAVMLGVADGHNSGLGGGCFVLIHRADGEMFAIDGRETAPSAASRDMYLRDGVVDTKLSVTGPLAVGVPGALAAYETAVSRFGKLPLRDSVLRAAKVAKSGFVVDSVYARNIVSVQEDIAQFPGTRAMLLKENGAPYLEGETLKLPDLETTYRKIAKDGGEWFYKGGFAKTIAEWMAKNGGLVTTQDFANYVAKDRKPITTEYRGHTIVGFPPPSSGGIHVAQILNILEHFDLAAMFQKDRQLAQHVIAEAMKLAFADRAHWLGDADFAKVPRGLVDKKYAKQLADRIQADTTINVEAHGLPENWQTDVYGKHTTHIATADAEGNWVAITATVNTSFGSKVVVPGTGLVLNNEMDDFSSQPGVPNAFGLIGAEANSIAPGKRPLSSMSPTIVLKDGKPILTVGAAGGPKIITQVVLAIVRQIDGKLALEQAVGSPRFHHQWRPDRLFIEESFAPDAIKRLQSFSHQPEILSMGGVTQAIRKRSDGVFIGISDPRVPGKAEAY